MNPSNVNTGNSFRSKFIHSSLVVIAPVALAAVAYFPAAFNSLTQLDDATYITDNPYLKDNSLHGIWAIFSSFYASNFHPITTLVYFLLYQLFGPEALPYHVISIVLHLFNTCLIFLLAKRLSSNQVTAVFVASFFALHPMHVESVAWASELKDVCYTAFYVLSVLYYLRYLDEGRKGQYKWVVLFFVLSLLSKPAAVSLPLMLLVIDWYRGRRDIHKMITEKAVLLALSFVFGVLNFLAQSAGDALNVIPVHYGFVDHLFLVTTALSYYLVSLFLPVRLCAMHYYPVLANGHLPWAFYLSVPFLALVVWAISRWRAMRRELIFGFLFFLVSIFLMLQIVSVGHSLYAERYTYVAYFGLLYATGQWISGPGKTRTLAATLAAIVLLVFSGLTWYRTQVWKNDEALYTDIIEKNEGSPFCFYPYFILAMNQYKEGNIQEALSDYNECIRLNPGYAVAYNNRGLVLLQTNQLQAALGDFDKAIAIDSGSAFRYNNRASVKASMGDFRGALKDYNFFLEKEPDNARAFADRGMVKLNLGDTTGACTDFRKSGDLGNGDAIPLYRQLCR